MMETFTAVHDGNYRLEPLSAQEVAQARSLCDSCVGKNLYSAATLAAAIEKKDHFFCLLKSESGETAGYIYFYLTDPEALAADAGVKKSRITGVCDRPVKKLGRIQSIGLKEAYRGRGLAVELIQYALKQLKTMSVDAAFIVCWKPNGVVPLRKALRVCGFRFLCDVPRPWYDDAELICPYCRGRCVCDGAVYYKIPGGTENETETSA